MKPYCQQRLLVVGPTADLKPFDWPDIPGATDVELLEQSPTRRSWQFVTEAPGLQFLRVLSRQWPRLTFFLDYDCEDQRLKGLIRARSGRVRHCRFNY